MKHLRVIHTEENDVLNQEVEALEHELAPVRKFLRMSERQRLTMLKCSGDPLRELQRLARHAGKVFQKTLDALERR